METSAAMDDYDVFLNHHGPDVKAGFLAHLDDALRAAGLNPFLDKTSLKKGDHAFRSIDDALKVSRIHVAVVSKGYAKSKYCLNELVVMMRSKKPVIPVFYGVEPAHLRRMENGEFAAAFEKHKSRETSEQVEEWADALHKLADITGFCFCLSDYEGDEAKLKHKVVNAILSLGANIETLQVERNMFGVEEHVNICMNKLETMSYHTTRLLGLVGMGGIGKTSLAKRIYNCFVGEKKFQAMSFLSIDHTSHSSMEVGSSLLCKLQKQLLWNLLRVSDGNQHTYKYWFQKLSSRGPVLVVLDDIHEKGQFDELILNANLLAPGSCIIVTSRDRHLLKVVGISNFYLHKVPPLGCIDSQKLFNLHAFRDEEAPKNFKALANDVSKACGGLPLALKVVGSNLFDKTSREDKKYIWPEAIDALKENSNVMSALEWSYNCLSKAQKLMFIDIACVFYGWKKEMVLEIWQSCKKCSSCCGSKTPYTSLRHLVDKSLVEFERDFSREDTLVMHGLFRKMGQGIGMINGSHLWKDKATNVLCNKNQGANKVRALNLANSGKRNFEAENFPEMPNLHYLILDGCDVSGNFGNISQELRCLQWRCMPLSHILPKLDFSNLISLDFSQSTKLAFAWPESNLAFEACPNLLRLNLRYCTSIRTLPDSLGHLYKLQKLKLSRCKNLQKLPSSIGKLTALQELSLYGCESLETLSDTITALSRLEWICMYYCSSLSKLPTSIGLMIGLGRLYIDLVTEWQALAIGQLKSIKTLGVRNCTNEAITVLDRSRALKNLHQLHRFSFIECTSMTKLPKTIGLLTNLDRLELFKCEKLQELPNSIDQLNMLTQLHLRFCFRLETLPNSLGTLTSLQILRIVECTSITNLPTSIGHLSSLRQLRIEGCGELRSLPDPIRHLTALESLIIMGCGSLEDLGAVQMLQGLRIWGCTSITELPGSCLDLVDSTCWDPTWLSGLDCSSAWSYIRRNLKELRVLETNDCGLLRYVEDPTRRQLILQRVYKSPCSHWENPEPWEGPGKIIEHCTLSCFNELASEVASWSAFNDLGSCSIMRLD